MSSNLYVDFTDFYGNPVRHQREIPTEIQTLRKWEYVEIDYSNKLPFDGWLAGMKLVSFEPDEYADPVCLYDKYGKIIAQWDDFPSYTELSEIILKNK